MRRRQQALLNVLITQPLIRAMMEAEYREIIGVEPDRGEVERVVSLQSRRMYAKRPPR